MDLSWQLAIPHGGTVTGLYAKEGASGCMGIYAETWQHYGTDKRFPFSLSV